MLDAHAHWWALNGHCSFGRLDKAGTGNEALDVPCFALNAVCETSTMQGGGMIRFPAQVSSESEFWVASQASCRLIRVRDRTDATMSWGGGLCLVYTRDK